MAASFETALVEKPEGLAGALMKPELVLMMVGWYSLDEAEGEGGVEDLVEGGSRRRKCWQERKWPRMLVSCHE
jgi:hypothetical protein